MSKIDLKRCATPSQPECWGNIDFLFAQRQTSKLQRRIAKAYPHDAKTAFLQNVLIHSTSAKALAVRSVVSNRGRNTPGVDDVVWVTDGEKMQAVLDLCRRGYKPSPLWRAYIPKPGGGRRRLGIPTMDDRAMQNLYKLALDPIAEVTADSHSFGFLAGRSAKDAILLCRSILQECPDVQWALEGDIKACFDNISHEWVLKNIPIDKVMLEKFLKCGYVENGKFYPTTCGVPQGGSISTVICNMALDGLQGVLYDRFHSSMEFIRYADDFIVTGRDKAALTQAIPVIEDFLSLRGLTLSPEKTVISRIEDGFDFLGWNVARKDGKVLIRPSDRNRDSLIAKVRNVLEHGGQAPSSATLRRLKQVIVGWRNYHIKVVDVYGIPYGILDIIAETKALVLRVTGDKQLANKVEEFFWSR